MAGFLSRLTGSNTWGSSGDDGIIPVPAFTHESRANMLQSLEETGLGWFWASDAEGRLIYLSEPAAAKIGKSVTAMTGHQLIDIFNPVKDKDTSRSERSLKFLLTARNSIRDMVVELQMEDAVSYWEISGVPQFDKSGAFAGYHGVARDVSAAVLRKWETLKLSQYDTLTGLSNRHHMAQHLEATLRSFASAKRSCALLLVDLDRFKQVNDSMGHPAGDELLKQASGRLRSVIGETAEIGRVGADEFQIVIPDEDDRGVLGDLALRIIQLLSQPYSVDGMRAVIGCSVGIAVAPFDGVEADELTKAADLALYAAKGGGRGRFRFYSGELQDQASQRHQIEADLRDAIARDELEMVFQPIVDATTHEVACVEALMRWNHTERGAISPADFIPVAEDVGIIRELGEWALNSVCRTIRNWPGTVKAAVNVSSVQFASDNFVEVVKRALKSSGVDPARIELEITETVFVGDMDRAQRVFAQLRELGVRLSLDDFGTGYSSLSYLRDAPFQKIKIDQSFVRGCSSEGNKNEAIIAAVVSLSRALGMETVAEGVETKDELDVVCEQGATHIQGRLFSLALTGDEVRGRLERGELKFVPRGPEKYRPERRTEFRKIGLIHDDDRYDVVLRNLSKTGAKIEGLLDVPVGTEMVLDLGGGQLAVATVRRSDGILQGVEFETQLISDGADGLCTRHRVSPYQIEAAGRPLRALDDEGVAAVTGTLQAVKRRFQQVDISRNSPASPA